MEGGVIPMNLASFLFEALSLYGLVFLIKDSHILKIPRAYCINLLAVSSYLLSCAFCLGVWVGLLYGIAKTVYIGYSPMFTWLETILYSFFSGAVCYILDLYTKKLEYWSEED